MKKIKIASLLIIFIVACTNLVYGEEKQKDTVIEKAEEVNNQQQTDTQQINMQNEADISSFIQNSPIVNLENDIDVSDPTNIKVNSNLGSPDQLEEWINGKAMDIVRIIQLVGQWVSFGVFIICGIKTVIGTFGKSGSVGKGVLGMAISAVAFVGIKYADVLFQWILVFLTN